LAKSDFSTKDDLYARLPDCVVTPNRNSEVSFSPMRCRKCKHRVPGPLPYCPKHSEGISNEYYTPEEYISLARKVMGAIDLDPASCESANRTVRAEKYYTKKTNGLEQQWHGLCYRCQLCGFRILAPRTGKDAIARERNRLQETLRTRVWCNPPYSKDTLSKFTNKLVREYSGRNVSQAVLLVNQYTDTQGSMTPWMLVRRFV
jgi:DNA-directed RNA polymerase subunit RPC12/RpoP